MSKEKEKENNKDNNSCNQVGGETAGTGAVLEAARREKLRKIKDLGFDPWGKRFDRQQSISYIRSLAVSLVKEEKTSETTTNPVNSAATNSAATNPATTNSATTNPAATNPSTDNSTDTKESISGSPESQSHQEGIQVRAAGRIMLQRKKGKLIFIDLWDWTGKIQILIGAKQVGEKYWELAQCFDLGDIIGVEGTLMVTRTGELSIAAVELTFLSKSLETPPEKFHGLTDPDLRSRMRYMDLIHTDGVMERMLKRSKIIQSVRETFAEENFVEVEGPTLHTIAGGAAARPFETYHNALSMPLFMRIALELHLKRLLVGGMERVYEIGRVYRNEGIDHTHNPEFTMLEAYQAYGDCNAMMSLTEKIITNTLRATNQGFVIEWNNITVDFTPPFARRTFDDLIAEYTNIATTKDKDIVIESAKALNIDTAGKHFDLIKNEIFEIKVVPNLKGPIFVTEFPAAICPLTKRFNDKPEIADRFELYIQSMELANAYTELNDPDLQEQLFLEQIEGQKAEDSMAKMDRDFIRALRHGMPPAGGLGIGIDRLCMILTNTNSIREVILFPLQRPEQNL
ncbi:MAG: lysine--tRNA ligase [Planctomycetaceae bacterium]|jgi:lysyl-tRNA synthetase class 2|nr:lysine--tRNA ligase [Planctomycetaceae bacterium]